MHGFILVFDLSVAEDPGPQLASWLADIDEHGSREQGARGARQPDKLRGVLVGNKSDRVSPRVRHHSGASLYLSRMPLAFSWDSSRVLNCIRTQGGGSGDATRAARLAQVQAVAAARGMPYLEASALTSTNVRELLLTCTLEILEAQEDKHS
eukprot:COSAG05_NODE_626_length_8254_cov_12.820846_7_plen_152_part_00